MRVQCGSDYPSTTQMVSDVIVSCWLVASLWCSHWRGQVHYGGGQVHYGGGQVHYVGSTTASDNQIYTRGSKHDLFRYSLSHIYFLWYKLDFHWLNSLMGSHRNKGLPFLRILKYSIFEIFYYAYAFKNNILYICAYIYIYIYITESSTLFMSLMSFRVSLKILSVKSG